MRPDVEKYRAYHAATNIEGEPWEHDALIQCLDYILALEAARDAVLPPRHWHSREFADYPCLGCMRQQFDAAVTRAEQGT